MFDILEGALKGNLYETVGWLAKELGSSKPSRRYSIFSSDFKHLTSLGVLGLFIPTLHFLYPRFRIC